MGNLMKGLMKVKLSTKDAQLLGVDDIYFTFLVINQ